MSSDTAKIGVAGEKINVFNILDKFVSNKGGQITKKIAAPIVISGPIKKFINNSIITVGDAAGQTKPTTGGGIYSGGMGGILAGQAMSRNSSREVLELLSKKGFPALGMDSPRGTNDPSLGAFAEILFKADLIVLLDKKWDFTLQFGSEEIISTNAKIIQIDSDKDVLNLTSATLGKAQNRLTTISSNSGPLMPPETFLFLTIPNNAHL